MRAWVKSQGGYDEGYEFLLTMLGPNRAEKTRPRPPLSTKRTRQRAASLGLAWPEQAASLAATLRFIHRHHETGALAPPRRQATTVEEFRRLGADMQARLERLPPAPLAVRPTDVFVATYPKCGTTWTQQIVHGLRTRGALDFPEISYVVPFIDVASLLGVDLEAEQVAAPRAFKTHLPWSRVPQGGRYIYVIRDPKDALLSAYHFFNGWHFERDALSVEEFSEETFLNDEGSPDGYWQHVRSWWEQRERENVLFLCFEDMKRDLEGTVRRIAAFMGLPADEELIAIATRQSTIDFMRARKDLFDERQMVAATSRLLGVSPDAGTTKVRSGRVGEGVEALPASVVTRLDEAWRREIAGPLGIRSYDELRALSRTLQ